MKRRTIIFSLLVTCILTVALSAGITLAKYTKTLQTSFEINIKEHTTYTYAVLENDSNTDTKTKLSIRNRQAVIVDGGEIGKTEGTSYLVDKDGTYDMTDIYALPTYKDKDENTISIAILENSTVPKNARTDGWDKVRGGNDFEKTITSVDFADPIKLQGDLRNLFYSWSSLETADLTNADFSEVTYLYEFFDGCLKLKTVQFSDNINTSKVTSMEKMFNYCESLVSVNVSGFDTENVESMMAMFWYCASLTSLDVSHFNTANVTRMDDMFHNCASLTTLDVSSFDTSKVTTMNEMFKYLKKMTVLDLSNFVVTVNTDTTSMFDENNKLEKIIVSENFVVNPNSNYIFRNNNKLVGGNGTTYSIYYTTGEYGRIDGMNGQKGYFTCVVQPKIDETLSGMIWDFVRDEAGNAINSAFTVGENSSLVLKNADGTLYSGTVVLENENGITETVTVTDGNLSISAQFMVAKTVFTIKAAD